MEAQAESPGYMGLSTQAHQLDMSPIIKSLFTIPKTAAVPFLLLHHPLASCFSALLELFSCNISFIISCEKNTHFRGRIRLTCKGLSSVDLKS